MFYMSLSVERDSFIYPVWKFSVVKGSELTDCSPCWQTDGKAAHGNSLLFLQLIDFPHHFMETFLLQYLPKNELIFSC